MIDYEVSQVQRWPIRNSPLGALLDHDRDLGKYGKVVPSGDPRILMVEARDPKRPEYGVITLIIQRKASATAGLEMYGCVALDSQNNRTRDRNRATWGKRVSVLVSRECGRQRAKQSNTNV